MRTKQDFENDPLIQEAIERSILSIDKGRVVYYAKIKKEYDWKDPEEWVRAWTFSYLVLKKGYSPYCIKLEVNVPRRTPEDFADIVVYSEESCVNPYLVVENKNEGITNKEEKQAIEQLFGNANSLRAKFGLLDLGRDSVFFDVANFPSTERTANQKGSRDTVPEQYGNAPTFTYIAGGKVDIKPVAKKQLEGKVKRSHSIIWAGGKRDPLSAFDEWSKIMLAKVEDERQTPTGKPRRFQIGTRESFVVVASRVRSLFETAIRTDPSIFPEGVSINLPDKKIVDVVQVLQDVSITDTSVDSIGDAFEVFFGSIFRGELGQYFTMRPLARFVVAMLNFDQKAFVLDPTCGSGGFLLEALLQTWHGIEDHFRGSTQLQRIQTDFALNQVYGVEIHDILARICKINLLLHHDGHTNIEAGKSCLDIDFSKQRLKGTEQFDIIVGNPPFGDSVKDGDEDQLGNNDLSAYAVAQGRSVVPSEHVILERSISWLCPGGKLGMILPDGVLNNQGDGSNCPQLRSYLLSHGKILAVVSLPDYAFRKSGAQNKTSILFYQRFSTDETAHFNESYRIAIDHGFAEEIALQSAIEANDYPIFMAEANHVGYTSTGQLSESNDLFKGQKGGRVDSNQTGTILGEFRSFSDAPAAYVPSRKDCIAINASKVWESHVSHRLDPKYHIFKSLESSLKPKGWVAKPISSLMERRIERVNPEYDPEKTVKVMTISQSGDIREREAGKGKNPPEWLGMYFEDSSSKWYRAKAGDLVYSGIDLWKGCIAIVPKEFDGALVTSEFPIYKMITDEISPEFLAILLRTRYYQRAFRAITTGHSNRRRTQQEDFEALEVCYPRNKRIQKALVKKVIAAKTKQKCAIDSLRSEMMVFSDLIDGRGNEEYESVSEEDENET